MDGSSLKQMGSFPIKTSNGEGWGATVMTIDDKDYFLVSDGSCNLQLWDPETLEEVGRKCITEDNAPVHNLNDLQVVKGKIFANIWLDDRIAVIDWEKGVVERWINLLYLKRLRNIPDSTFSQNNAVLNGIAYNAEKDTLYVTGKNWNRLFQIRLLPFIVCCFMKIRTTCTRNSYDIVILFKQGNRKSETSNQHDSYYVVVFLDVSYFTLFLDICCCIPLNTHCIPLNTH